MALLPVIQAETVFLSCSFSQSQGSYDEQQYRLDLRRDKRTSFTSQIASKFLSISPLPSNFIHAPKHTNDASSIAIKITTLVGCGTTLTMYQALSTEKPSQ